MPHEENRDNNGGELHTNASTNTPIQPTGYAKPTRLATDADANGNTQKIEKLEEDIKGGEKWLIIIGIATLVINVIIACIYYGQLKEMRKATQATRDAVDISSRTLLETQRSNARQAGLTEQALKASIEQFRQDQRAWIAPTNAYLTSDVMVGKPLSFEVSYNDVGKQPAFAVRPTYTIKLIDRAAFDANKSNAMIEADNACKGKHIAEGADVIYPGQPEGYKLQFTLPSTWPDSTIVSGGRAMVLEMCFTYKTIREVHHTSFCYFYRKGVTKDAHLDICTAGNHAD